MPAQKYKTRDLSESPEPSASNIPSFKQAAAILAGHFKTKGIDYVFIGGFALKLLGHTRSPGDVDCVVDGKLAEIYTKLESIDGGVHADHRT